MRLIDANALKITIKNMPNDYGDLCIGDVLKEVLKEIDNAPTIDAVPMATAVQGEWIENPDYGAKMESEGST